MKYLFDMPREPLKLEIQDVANNRWPFDSILFQEALEMYLARKGWDLTRVKELQESISAKMTVDMFTEQTDRLDAAELELQADIDKFLKGVSS